MMKSRYGLMQNKNPGLRGFQKYLSANYFLVKMICPRISPFGFAAVCRLM
jgi:hypothetical protein